MRGQTLWRLGACFGNGETLALASSVGWTLFWWGTWVIRGERVTSGGGCGVMNCGSLPVPSGQMSKARRWSLGDATSTLL